LHFDLCRRNRPVSRSQRGGPGDYRLDGIASGLRSVTGHLTCLVLLRGACWNGRVRGAWVGPSALGVVAAFRTRGLLVGALMVFVFSGVVSLLMVLLARG